MEFIDKKEAKIWLKTENTWRKMVGTRIRRCSNSVTTFSCNKVKFRSAIKCNAYIQFISMPNGKISLLKSGEHTHDEINPDELRKEQMPSNIQEKIDFFVASGINGLKQLKAAFAANMIDVSNYTDGQLKIALKLSKDSHFEIYAKDWAFLEWQVWFGLHESPESIDKMIIFSENGTSANSEHLPVFLTTKRLLQNAINQYILVVRTTTLNNFQDRVTTLIDIIDGKDLFHLVGVAVSNVQCECKENIVQIFDLVTKAVLENCDIVFRPKVSFIDAKKFMIEAVIEKLGTSVKLRLFSKDVILQIIKSISNQRELKDLLAEDLMALRDYLPHYLFENIAHLLLKKYEKEETLVNYIKNEFFKQNATWHSADMLEEQFRVNALENCDLSFKSIQKLPVNMFFNEIEDRIETVSKQYSSNEICIQKSVEFSIECWKTAYKWHIDKDFKLYIYK